MSERQSKDFPNCFYRVTVKGFCVRDGKLLMVRESQTHSGGVWELPGGGLDFGENFAESLQREVEEEMGVKVTKISEKPIYIWTTKFENRRGMDWYHVLALGYRIEIDSLDITPSDECEEVKFYTKEEISNLKLNANTQDLPRIFNPEDFKDLF